MDKSEARLKKALGKQVKALTAKTTGKKTDGMEVYVKKNTSLPKQAAILNPPVDIIPNTDPNLPPLVAAPMILAPIVAKKKATRKTKKASSKPKKPKPQSRLNSTMQH